MDSGLTAYLEALDALFARTGATSKFGLDRTHAFLDILGNPHERLRVLHVAGTNGKGSVVAMLYTLLRARGLSVGKYTSPHLIDFNERIVVDDDEMSDDFALEFLETWGKRGEELGATFFEITTAMAFHYFSVKGVDAAVVETGLGGRLDATNVVRPFVAGITSISLDHTEFLGNTEEEIAAEKAGILKRGVPGVIGPVSPGARDSILRVARAAGVESVIDAQSVFPTGDVRVSANGTSFTIGSGGESLSMTTGLVGTAQAGNASVALAMLQAAGPEWEWTLADAARVLPSVTLPGRFQRIGPYVLDVAHNPDGTRSLARTLEGVHPPGPVVAVLGVLHDKDWRNMILALQPLVKELILVAPPSAPAQRAWNPDEALAFAKAHAISAEFNPDFADAVRSAPTHGLTVLVTGSFHTVGDALQVLQSESG